MVQALVVCIYVLGIDLMIIHNHLTFSSIYLSNRFYSYNYNYNSNRFYSYNENVRNTASNRAKPHVSAHNDESRARLDRLEQADPSSPAKIRRDSHLSQSEGIPPSLPPFVDKWLYREQPRDKDKDKDKDKAKKRGGK